MLGELVFILDKIGIVAFAFAGVSKGVQKKLDIFGLFIVGMSTAIAGGVIRDTMLANVPYAIMHIDYLGYAFAASIISILAYNYRIIVPDGYLKVADTVGLGVFAGAGVAVALSAGLSVFHTILFAIITAVGGGILRDILVNEVPFVLRKELYAIAAGLGGLVSYIVFMFGYGVVGASLTAIVITILVRWYAISKKLHLPVIK
jgi:uncharacterized membrane protein YeiH